MSREQRVGQLLAVGLADNRVGPAQRLAIRSDHLGTVWFVHKSTAGTAGIRAVSDSVQALATSKATAGVRLFVAANQEGGLIQSMTGTGFSTIPSALAQSTRSTATLRRDAERWGRQLRAAGINFDYAPVMDVVPPGTDDSNQPIGVLKRGYGHDPATVTAHGVAFLRGMAAAGVATSAKHFPGLGRVVGNTDFTAGVVDRVTTRDDPYLQTFAASVQEGVPFVMVALATYTKIDPDHLAVFSPIVIRQLLREQLGFGGVVISDDMGAAKAVATIAPGRRAIDFLLAGGDMVISKTIGPADAMYRAILARADADKTFARFVDSSTLRVLRAKQAAGLLPCGS
ncbi:MAG: beta-N-acetylhexosaminidase [Actinomycetota bacterium]|nr:beta-N-acetylhexosaminidase [Actinomycetota bacterium]